MAGKFSFRLARAAPRQDFPDKLVVGQQEMETPVNVLLKALAYLLLFRERLQVDVNLHMDAIAFRPSLVQLDYELRPKLWVECGECTPVKLDKLAVKVPEAEIWIVRQSLAAAETLLRGMSKAGLRRNRYHLMAFDAAMIEEMSSMIHSRNELFWVSGGLEPAELQLEFNGLWFDSEFHVLRF
jgi:hypothetical protein